MLVAGCGTGSSGGPSPSVDPVPYDYWASIPDDPDAYPEGQGDVTQPYDACAWNTHLRAPIPLPRMFGAAATLPDGRVMVAGGFLGRSLRRVDLYNPATNQWERGVDLPKPRSHHALVVLNDGTVLSIGGAYFDGENGSEPKLFREVNAFDPRTNEWSSAGPLPTPMLFPKLVPVGEGRYFASGLFDWSDEYVGAILDTATMSWRVTPRLSVFHKQSEAIVLADESVLVAFTGSSQTFRYVPSTDSWEFAGVRPSDDEVAMVSQPGSVLAVSRWGRTTASFDPARKIWSRGPTLRSTHGGARPFVLSSELYVASGLDEHYDPIGVIERLDSLTSTWKTAARLHRVRWQEIVVVADGSAYFISGATRPNFVSTTESFRPEGGGEEDPCPGR